MSTLESRQRQSQPSGLSRPALVVGGAVTGVLATVLAKRRRRPTWTELEAARREADGPEVQDNSDRPDPDDPRKPDSPTDLTRRSKLYVVRQTAREFVRDECTDLAAALTYYAVLSIFPALVVIVSLLGVVGQGQRTSDSILEIVGDVAPGGTADTLRPTVEQLVAAPSAGIALVIGILGALWSASGYVGAFSRAMNRIYEVQEGRPVWKLRPLQLLLTFGALVVAAIVLLLLAVSGPVAEAIGSVIGLGETAVTVWNVARWPVLLVLIIAGVAVLYYAGPNVQQPKFRWVSVGAVFAIVTWVIVSIGFGVYVSNFGSYNKTYGALAGVIVFLLWLWITNLALLFGAELDSELERGRQLQAGIEAEEDLKLPLRDTSLVDKNAKQEQKDVEQGRALRKARGRETVSTP